jgi:hypothetical protein
LLETAERSTVILFIVVIVIIIIVFADFGLPVVPDNSSMLFHINDIERRPGDALY